jgi:hypothetical protein
MVYIQDRTGTLIAIPVYVLYHTQQINVRIVESQFRSLPPPLENQTPPFLVSGN